MAQIQKQNEMAIAPITGLFARRIYRDVIGSITLGVVAANVWWHYAHKPQFAAWREYDAKVKLEMEVANKPYYDALKAVQGN